MLGGARRSCSCSGGDPVVRGSVDLVSGKKNGGDEEMRIGMGKKGEGVSHVGKGSPRHILRMKTAVLWVAGERFWAAWGRVRAGE